MKSPRLKQIIFLFFYFLISKQSTYNKSPLIKNLFKSIKNLNIDLSGRILENQKNLTQGVIDEIYSRIYNTSDPHKTLNQFFKFKNESAEEYLMRKEQEKYLFKDQEDYHTVKL